MVGRRYREVWSLGEIPARLGAGGGVPLPRDTDLGCPFFPPACVAPLELRIWGSELSLKGIIQFSERESEGKSIQVLGDILGEVQGETRIKTGEPQIVKSTFKGMEGRAGRTK